MAASGPPCGPQAKGCPNFKAHSFKFWSDFNALRGFFVFFVFGLYFGSGMNFWVSATIYHWLQLWSNSDTTEYFLALHPVFSQNGKMFAPKWIIFFLVNSCHDQLKISCFVPDITLGGLYPFLGVLSLFVHTNDCVGGWGVGVCGWGAWGCSTVCDSTT